MRFPFFKNEKVETKPAPRAPITIRRSSLADTQPLQRLPGATKSDTQPMTPSSIASGPCIKFGVASIAQQLPQQLFTDAGRTELNSITLSLPAGLVLPQLSTGKVSVKLEDLIALFPPQSLRSPLPPVSDQQCVVLPLHEIIAAMPADLLTIQHDSVISADDPELEKLPKVIDDALMNAAPVATPEPEKPQSQAPASPLVVPPKPKTTDAPEYVMVSLRALVNVMPDSVFCCPRTQLGTKVNLDAPVLLPTDPIIPQLRGATVKLPLSIIIALVPHQVLANPMPSLEGQMIPIPLAEIISQLPKSVFTDSLREPVQESDVAYDEIPDPFKEKSALAEEPAIAEPAPEPFAGELGVEEAALTDDSFSIFSERSPAPAVEPVTPPPVEAVAETPVAEPVPQSVEPVVEPVAELPQAAEPVAEVQEAVEPVIEPVSEPLVVAEPAAQAEVAPVIESEPEPAVAEATPEVVAPVVTPEPEPVAEPATQAETAPVAESEPEPVVAEAMPEVVNPVVIPESEPVAETATQAEITPVVEPEPEPVVAEATPEVVAPVATPEPETVVEPVAAIAPEVVEPVAEATESETELEPTVDEKKLIVDLNRCTVEDLTTIPGVGRALAQRIIDFRNSRGHFHSVHELRQVPGIGRKTFRALAGVQPRALNRLLGAPHDGELTLQEIVRLAGKLDGIEGCMLATSDGLFLTGELPPHLDQSTISVFAPQLFKKVGRYARELKVGSIRRFTIFTDTQPISIFRAGDVYLIVIHDAFRYSKALLRRCERISQEIARLSSQRVTV